MPISWCAAAGETRFNGDTGLTKFAFGNVADTLTSVVAGSVVVGASTIGLLMVLISCTTLLN